VLKVIWRESALAGFDEIAAYIAEQNPAAADRLQSIIEASAGRIAEHPFMHRLGRVKGTREAIVHPNYILVYRVTTEAVEILKFCTLASNIRRAYPANCFSAPQTVVPPIDPLL
jgi:toxin ParE1/3/4